VAGNSQINQRSAVAGGYLQSSSKPPEKNFAPWVITFRL
jgi:hypothetical protein